MKVTGKADRIGTYLSDNEDDIFIGIGEYPIISARFRHSGHHVIAGVDDAVARLGDYGEAGSQGFQACYSLTKFFQCSLGVLLWKNIVSAQIKYERGGVSSCSD